MKHDRIDVENSVVPELLPKEKARSLNRMSNYSQLYSVYLSSSTVELREIEDERSGDIRLVCSQSNYQNIFDFAVKLARDRHLPFRNFVSI